MKILITEDQLDKVIDLFLKRQMEEVETLHTDNDGYRRIFFLNKKKKELWATHYPNDGETLVSPILWKLVHDMFCTDQSLKCVKKIICKWFDQNVMELPKNINKIILGDDADNFNLGNELDRELGLI